MGINGTKEKMKDCISRNESEIPLDLRKVPKILWIQMSTVVGLLTLAQPVQIKTKEGVPPAGKQYPIPSEVHPSIQREIDAF